MERTFDAARARMVALALSGPLCLMIWGASALIPDADVMRERNARSALERDRRIAAEACSPVDLEDPGCAAAVARRRRHDADLFHLLAIVAAAG